MGKYTNKTADSADHRARKIVPGNSLPRNPSAIGGGVSNRWRIPGHWARGSGNQRSVSGGVPAKNLVCTHDRNPRCNLVRLVW